MKGGKTNKKESEMTNQGTNQIDTEVRQEKPLIWTEKGDLAYWADVCLAIEKMRVALQVALTHLGKVGRISPDREEFLKRLRGLEAYADSHLAIVIVSHPTWSWASRILGIGKETYPKLIGRIEKFGRYYDINNPEEKAMIPSYVHRPVEHYLKVEKGKVVEKDGIFVEGIERLETPSKLFKFVGKNVEEETGEAPRRRKGHKLPYDADAKMAVHRVSTSLMRATGIWYHGGDDDGCSRGYCGYRDRLVQAAEVAGVKVVPTPKERMCLECGITVVEKKTEYCPKCGVRLSLKKEPTGYLYEGHLHMRTLRLMEKDFLVCMWLVWRAALGLPVTQPYSVVKLDHKPLDPWKMVDKTSQETQPE